MFWGRRRPEVSEDKQPRDERRDETNHLVPPGLVHHVARRNREDAECDSHRVLEVSLLSNRPHSGFGDGEEGVLIDVDDVETEKRRRRERERAKASQREEEVENGFARQLTRRSR